MMYQPSIIDAHKLEREREKKIFWLQNDFSGAPRWVITCAGTRCSAFQSWAFSGSRATITRTARSGQRGIRGPMTRNRMPAPFTASARIIVVPWNVSGIWRIATSLRPTPVTLGTNQVRRNLVRGLPASSCL